MVLSRRADAPPVPDPTLFPITTDLLPAAGLALRQLCCAMALTLTAYVSGRTLLALLGVAPLAATAPPVPPIPPTPAGGAGTSDERGARAAIPVLAIALGLAVIASTGLLLGLAGRLEPAPVAAAALALHGAGLPAWRSLLRRRPWRPRALVLAGAAVAVLPATALTLYPPTAFDATLYHLTYARAFAAAGSMPFLPDLRTPIFPQLAETVFAMLLPFGGDLAAQAMTLLATALTTALLLAWGWRWSPAAGWIAAAAHAGSPIVVFLAGTAYVEPTLVLFATVALYAVARWRQGGGAAWLTLAALFAGAAADTKYLGLLVVALVLAAALALRPRPPAAPRWQRLLAAAAVAGLMAAPWYGRIVAATGNPVFPFLPSVFGSTPWDPLWLKQANGLLPLARRLAVGLARLPWDTVFARARLGGNPPYSPIFLLASPALVAGAVLRRRTRALLLVACAYTPLSLALRPDARYLLLALPPLCLATGDSLAAALDWLRARRPDRSTLAMIATIAGKAAAVLALVIFLPGWLYALYRIHRQGPLPATEAARDAYLARALPAYSTIRFLNRTCGAAYTLYGVHAENMSYFVAGRFLGDWTGPASYQRVLPEGGDARLLYQRLRAFGVDHLMILTGDRMLPPYCSPGPPGSPGQQEPPGSPGPAALPRSPDSPDFTRLFHQVRADPGARLFSLRGTPDCTASAVSRATP